MAACPCAKETISREKAAAHTAERVRIMVPVYRSRSRVRRLSDHMLQRFVVNAAIAVFVTAVVLSVPSAALACSCGGQASSSNGLASADVVFLGIVAPKADWSRSGVVFDVVRTFKGPANGRVTVAGGDGLSFSTCDIAFSPGERWLVYARQGDGPLQANKCARTRLESDAGQDLL